MANQIKVGAILSYVTICINMILGLLYTPWMINHIGTSAYGLYALSGTFIAYFMLDFGLGSAVGRFLSLAVANKDEKNIKSTINTAFRIYIIIDIIVFILLFFIYFFLDEIFIKLTVAEIHDFKIVFCISAFFSILSFPLMPFNGTMIAYEKFIQLKTIELVQKVSAVVFTIFALLVGYGLFAVVFINAVVAFLCNVYKLIYTWNNLNIKVSIVNYDKNLAKSLFSFSIWVFIIGIAQRLVVTLSPTILGIRANTMEITIYAVASTLEAYVWTFSNALNGLFMPRISSMVAKNVNRKELTDLMIRVGRIQLIICGLIISGLFVLGKPFLNLWMGPEFVKSYYVVILMVATGIISLTQAIADTLLYVENEVRYRAVIYCSSAVISFVVGYVLAGYIGAIGCGIGIFFSLFSTVIGMNIVYSRKLNLQIGRFFKECHLKIIWPIIICSILALLVQKILPISSWYIIFMYVCVYTLIFIGLQWFLTMNKCEKELMLSLYCRFFNRCHKISFKK